MYNYNTLILDFLQYKRELNYVYKTEETILKNIARFLTDNKINEITKEVTEKYAKNNKNLNSNSVARNMAIFREFNKYLNNIGITCYQIPNKIYPQNHHNFWPHVFTYDEMNNIYLNLNYIYNSPSYSYYKKITYPLVIKLLYQTGMRIGEVLNITISDYKIDYFIIRDTKNGKDRKIMIPNSLNEEIKKLYNKYYKESNITDKFFNVGYEAISKYFKEILKRTNIKINDNGPRLHDLRFTYLLHIIEKFRKERKDVDAILPLLQIQLGHQSLKALSYYVHLNTDVLNELCEISNQKFNYLIPLEEDYHE